MADVDPRRACRAGVVLAAALIAWQVGVRDSRAQEVPAARPRVGVALGGGSARGLAHIGVLRWFDEHRIPIDVIAGTSMGGLVGGAWATGLDPDELAQLMQHTDWDRMFQPRSPFADKTFRRKEDARAYPAQFEFGLKRGFKLPSGLNNGQYVELLLDRITLAYGNLDTFDALPTPFRCVATDLNSGSMVVLGSGSLSRAMRATMSLPGIFIPVPLDDKLLVDGGTLDNIPADVVAGMLGGPDGSPPLASDAIVAVDVSADVEGTPKPDTIFGVMNASVDAMMQAGTRAALKSATIIIDPDLKGLGSLDWRRSEELAARGYAAAEAQAPALLAYQVGEEEYAAWKAERARQRRTTLPVPAFVEVTGVPPRDAEVILDKFAAKHVGRPIDVDEIERDVLTIAGTERYETIGYRLAYAGSMTGLELAITPKSTGPPFLLPAFELENTQSSSFTAGLRARLATYDTFVLGSELRLDIGIGTNPEAAVEIYRRIGRSPLFIAPRAGARSTQIEVFSGDRAVAGYRDHRENVGIDFGVALGSTSEFRTGYDVTHVRLKRRIGDPVIDEASGANRFWSARWVYDGQDSPTIPSQGAYVKAGIAHYFATPSLVSPAVRRGPSSLTQAEAGASVFGRWLSRERVFLVLAGGTSFKDEAVVNRFTLGGFMRLSSFANGALSGNHYVRSAAGLLHEWFRLPDFLGGYGYLGGWLEAGSAFDDWRSARYHGSAAGGLVLDTFVGPVSLIGAFDFEGHGRVYVAVGTFVHP